MNNIGVRGTKAYKSGKEILPHGKNVYHVMLWCWDV